MSCPAKTFFCYLQLRSFLRTTLGPKMTLPVLSDIEKLLHEGNVPGFISKVYVLLMEGASKSGLHKSRGRWESDLDITIDAELWSELCQKKFVCHH